MIDDKKREVLHLFSEGRRLYKTHDFVNAMEKFKKAQLLDPTDGPTQVFVTRCKLYIENPPSEGWDGVFDMKTK